jgi:molybdate transport system substrate-binding protein
MGFNFNSISIYVACLFSVTYVSVYADTDDSVSVAVASNFAPAIRELAREFEQTTGYRLQISPASTGKLYAQIINGAPFDILLAADIEHPRLLEDSTHGVAGTRFTYATGSLILWSRDPAITADNCRASLADLGNQHLAIANPLTAPYGKAARETLETLQLWDSIKPQLVMGENIAQTLQFVASGNARLGFIATAQSADKRLPSATCQWQVPPEFHQPIEQQAILLTRAANDAAATTFMNFLRSPESMAVIKRHGYVLP